MADFWLLLERSSAAGTDPRSREEWLEYRLSRIAVSHIVDFQIHLDTARRPIDTWTMMGAADEIMDGLCGTDAFWYFQPWLIGQGQRWWRHAAQNPDNLVDLPAVQALAGRRPQEWADSEWPDWADLSHVAARAYDHVTGQDGIADGIDEALGERGHRRRWESEMTGTMGYRQPYRDRTALATAEPVVPAPPLPTP